MTCLIKLFKTSLLLRKWILFFGIMLGGEQAYSSGTIETTDLYVSPSGSDANTGTKAGPFRTIIKASGVVSAGGTVHVAPGSYEGGFKTIANGTATARISYVSDTRWGAKIVAPANSTTKTGFDNRGHYVTIDGFEVDGTPQAGTAWTVGINVAATGNIVTNCHVHHIFVSSSGNSGGGAGILLDSWYGFNDMQAIGNLVHEVGPQPPLTGGKFYQGIYQTATGSMKNNIVYMVSGAGLHLWHDANHIDIVNNTSFNNWIGIVFGGGNYIHTKGPCDYVNVVNNIVYDNTGYGIDETGQNGSHNLISNNLVFQNPENFFLKVTPHLNDVIADPEFVNYKKTGGGDYHLKRKSPAISKGLPAFAPPSDYDGKKRPKRAGFDLGALERR